MVEEGNGIFEAIVAAAMPVDCPVEDAVFKTNPGKEPVSQNLL